MRRTIIGFVFVFMTVASAAQAVTLKDIVDLTKAGLGDEVLLALIEVDARVFSIDTDTLTRLKAAGVSERVIIALVRSGRTPPPPTEQLTVAPAPVEAPPAQVVYVEQPPVTIVREVAVPVYVGVPVSRTGSHQRAVPVRTDTVQPSITAPPEVQGQRRYLTDTPPPAKAEPVYWGWGGKLRPDAWKPK